MTARLARAELLRLRSARTTLTLVAIGVFLVVLSTLGQASLSRDELAKGTTTLGEASRLLVGLSFVMVLFSALGGALQVTSEHRSRAIGLTTLVCPRRTPVLAAKAAVAALVGAAFGALGLVGSTVAALLSMRAGGYDLPLGRSAVELACGTLAVCALAGPWGVFVGTVVRTPVAAVAGLVVWTTMLEAAIANYLPDVGRWLPGGAQAAVVADPLMPDRLSRGAGAVVEVLWLAAAAGLAVHLFRTRDV
jgi:ABC-2 type transport system permease protein